jgi:S-formylglutathione hydrolase FrmB
MFLDLGVPRMLTAAVNANLPPFAVVALDGGDSYWVARDPADDPQRMLREDLPTWLGNRGLADRPFASLGISMGAYGALNHARTAGMSAVGVVSPALFTSWPEARSRGAFADQSSWTDTDPLRHVEGLRAVPLGVWCGTADPFITPARRLVSQARPAVSAIESGGHDAAYWRRVLPEVLRFVGERRG